jgi:hypothetical protein
MGEKVTFLVCILISTIHRFSATVEPKQSHKAGGLIRDESGIDRADEDTYKPPVLSMVA